MIILACCWLYLAIALITTLVYWVKTRSDQMEYLIVIGLVWPITLVYARILRNRLLRYRYFDTHAHVLVERVVYYDDEDDRELVNKVIDAYIMHQGERKHG